MEYLQTINNYYSRAYYLILFYLLYNKLGIHMDNKNNNMAMHACKIEWQ